MKAKRSRQAAKEEKLPTVEQIEIIMDEWGACSVDDFAERFGLDRSVVEETVGYIRQLRRVDRLNDIPPVACLRSDRLLSIVRCAGARRGYT